MKKITLKSLYDALAKEQYVITVPEEIRVKALGAIQRMLEVPRNF